jgi:hypothetical protein
MGKEKSKRDLPQIDGFLLDLYRTDSAESAAAQVISVCRDVFKVRAVMLLRRLGDHLVPFQWHGVEEEAIGHKVRSDGPVAARLSSGAPMHMADVRGDVIRALGGRRAVPALGRSELVSVIVIDAPDHQEDLWAFVEHIAPHVGLALEDRFRMQPRVTSPTEETVDDHTRWVQVFGRPGTVRQMASRVAKTFGEVMGSDRVFVYRHDPGHGQLMRLATRGFLEGGGAPHELEEMGLPRVLSTGADQEGPLHLAVREGAPQWEESTDQTPWAAGPDSRGSACFPLITGDGVVGVVGLVCPADAPPLGVVEPHVLEMMESAAVAIERSMLLEPLLFDNEFPILDGRFVEALLCDAVRRADRQDRQITVVSMRLGESSTHRAEEPARPIPIDALIEGLVPMVDAFSEAFGYLGQGRVVAILKGTHASNAVQTVQGWADRVAYLRGSVSVHAFGILERRPHERWDSVWARAHTLCAQIYDEGPGLRIGMSGAMGEEVIREGVPDWVTPNPVDHR